MIKSGYCPLSSMDRVTGSEPVGSGPIPLGGTRTILLPREICPEAKSSFCQQLWGPAFQPRQT